MTQENADLLKRIEDLERRLDKQLEIITKLTNSVEEMAKTQLHMARSMAARDEAKPVLKLTELEQRAQITAARQHEAVRDAIRRAAPPGSDPWGRVTLCAVKQGTTPV